MPIEIDGETYDVSMATVETIIDDEGPASPIARVIRRNATPEAPRP